MKTAFKWILGAIGLLIAYMFYESRTEIEKMGMGVVVFVGAIAYNIITQQNLDRNNTHAAIERLHERIRHLEGWRDDD